MTFRVLICDPISDQGVRLMEKKGLEINRAWNLPKSDLAKIIHDYDAVVVRSATKITADLLSKARRLKVIGRAGDGLDNIDIKKAAEMGIDVVNTPQIAATSVAELTIGHLIALARGIVEGTLSLREGKWAKEDLMGVEISGKTLGIVGCGSIGKTVERLALALGMKVIGVDMCVYGRFVTLEDMLPEVDFITIHVPLTPHTRHLISKREFGIMKSGVMLIDCSRGGVVDQEALYSALLSGRVKAAALDVFEEEPPRESKLLSLKNVHATPHIGSQTHEAQARASVLIAKKVIDALEKTPG